MNDARLGGTLNLPTESWVSKSIRCNLNPNWFSLAEVVLTVSSSAWPRFQAQLITRPETTLIFDILYKMHIFNCASRHGAKHMATSGERSFASACPDVKLQYAQCQFVQNSRLPPSAQLKTVILPVLVSWLPITARDTNMDFLFSSLYFASGIRHEFNQEIIKVQWIRGKLDCMDVLHNDL